MAACCALIWCPLRASPTANPCTHPVFSLECLLCLGLTSCVRILPHLTGWCSQRAATGQPQPCTDRKGVHSNRCWAVQAVLCMQRIPPYLSQHASAPAPPFLVLSAPLLQGVEAPVLLPQVQQDRGTLKQHHITINEGRHSAKKVDLHAGRREVGREEERGCGTRGKGAPRAQTGFAHLQIVCSLVLLLVHFNIDELNILLQTQLTDVPVESSSNEGERAFAAAVRCYCAGAPTTRRSCPGSWGWCTASCQQRSRQKKNEKKSDPRMQPWIRCEHGTREQKTQGTRLRGFICSYRKDLHAMTNK